MSTPQSEVTDTYQRQGYVVAEQVLPRQVAEAFLAITQKGMGETREAQARFTAAMQPLDKPAYDLYDSDYLPAMTLLWGLTPFMSQLTGKFLLPTYSYFRVYQGGGLCLVHSDRPACEHSMSLTLGYSEGRVWPFDISRRRLLGPDMESAQADFGDDGHESLHLTPGDAIVYQGVHYRHGRLVPNPNQWSAHIFMHWVDRDGPFSDQGFDKRRLPTAAEFKF